MSSSETFEELLAAALLLNLVKKLVKFSESNASLKDVKPSIEESNDIDNQDTALYYISKSINITSQTKDLMDNYDNITDVVIYILKYEFLPQGKIMTMYMKRHHMYDRLWIIYLN